MSQAKKFSSVVVFSGGQDSTTVLAQAIKDQDGAAKDVLAVSYRYGQRHSKSELAAAAEITSKLGVEHVVFDLTELFSPMQSSALIDHTASVNVKHEHADVPKTFVPARNALFLTHSFGLCLEYGATRLYTGVCQTDFSGYSDCRDRFIRILNGALNEGYEANIEIKTPLMFLSKAETFALADELGHVSGQWVLDLVLNTSHTCYIGDPTINEWGKGCGDCPACELRARGYAEWNAPPAPAKGGNDV